MSTRAPVSGARRRGGAGAPAGRFQRLDVALDFEAPAEFVADRMFERGDHFVRLAERQAPVHFGIEADGLALPERLHGDVMDRHLAAVGDEQHAVDHRFVVEGDGLRRDHEARVRVISRDGIGDRLLDRGDALDRQGS